MLATGWTEQARSPVQNGRILVELRSNDTGLSTYRSLTGPLERGRGSPDPAESRPPPPGRVDLSSRVDVPRGSTGRDQRGHR